MVPGLREDKIVAPIQDKFLKLTPPEQVHEFAYYYFGESGEKVSKCFFTSEQSYAFETHEN
jgi:hypothetical protein